MSDIKLIALDAEDLAIIAAHLQDAVLRIEDMAYLKAARRFAFVVNRFDWSHAAQANGPDGFVRKRAGVRFEHVIGAQVQGIDLTRKDEILSLLTVTFTPLDEPHGAVLLTFAGGGAVRLEVECIEAALSDLGAAWTTSRRPEHAGD